MFEDSNLFIGLDDVDDGKRIDAIDQLRISVRQSDGELPVHNLTQLFQMLSDRVVDTNVNVARKSAELLCDLLNRDLQTTDIYFPIVLPALFQTLSEDDRRETSVHVLTTYVEAMGSVECVMEGLIQHGLKHDNVDVRAETLLAIPTIAEGYLVPSAAAGREDYMKLLASMIDRLHDENEHVVDAAETALRFANDEDKNFWKHVERLGREKLELVTRQFSSKARARAEDERAQKAKDVEQKVEKIESPRVSPNMRQPVASPITKSKRANVGVEMEDTQSLLEKELVKAMERRARITEMEREDKDEEEDKTEESSGLDDKNDDFENEDEDEAEEDEDEDDDDDDDDEISVNKDESEEEEDDDKNSETSNQNLSSASSSGDLEQSSNSVIDPPDLGSPPGLKYGFLPADVIDGLNDKDAWKVRAAAVENFLSIVQKLSNEEVDQLKPHMEDLLDFMSLLLDDGNFKISITALQILSILCVRVGDEMSDHFPAILHSLVNRLGDNTVVARNTALEVFQQLLKVVGGGKVLDNLLVMLDNPNWYIREGIVKVAMQALLTRPIEELELPQLVVGLVHILHDKRPKVKFAVTEALAILHNRAGKEIDVLALVEGLDRSEDAEETMNDLKARFAMPASTLPSMNSNGHVVYTSTDSYAPPPTPAGSGGGGFNSFNDSTGSSHSGGGIKKSSDAIHRSRSASSRRHPSAGRVSSRKIPFNVPRPLRAATAGSQNTKNEIVVSPKARKKGPATAIGTERVDEGRVWRQKDHVDRRLNELKGRDGAPFQLHISDTDALDFDTYSKSLFEDPFEFQKSTVPPSPTKADHKEQDGSPTRERRRVRQFVASPLAADPRRSAELGTPKSRRGPRSVRSPFPFAASPEPREKKDPKISLWLPDNEKESKAGRPGIEKNSSRSSVGNSSARSRRSQSSEADSNSTVSARGDQSARGDPGSARGRGGSGAKGEAGSNELGGGLGIVGSGMNVAQRGRQRAEEGGKAAVVRRRGGPTPRGSRNPRDGGHYIPDRHDDKERRPNSLAKRNSGRREVQSGWEEEGSQSSPRVFEPSLGRSLRGGNHPSDPAQQVWPPQAPNDGGKHIGKNGARDLTRENDVDVRLSADDIRDRLRSLKSRGGARQSRRAASANGVIENDSINELDLEDPRNLKRAETVSPTNYAAQERQMGDDRPIRPMRSANYASAARHHHDPRFQTSNSAPASSTAENDWAAEGEYERTETQRRDRERKVSAATMRRREYLKQVQEQEARAKSVSRELDQEELAKKKRIAGRRSIGGNRYGRQNRAGKPKVSPRPSGRPSQAPVENDPNKEYDHSKRTAEYLASDQIKPLKNEVIEMRRAMKDLTSDQWDNVFDALNVIRALALHHQDTIGPALHGIVLSVNKASKNLRSAVAKNGLLTLNDMIDGLGPLMDPELDTIVVHLLKRASESGTGFVGDEADRCLRSMCVSCSESKALSSLLNCANNKTPQVRACTAQLIEYCISQMGTRICGARDLNRLISAAVKFMGEPQQDARRAGRRIFYGLHKVGAVTERQLRRLLQERELRQVMDLIEKGRNGYPIDDYRVSSSRSMSRQQRQRRGSRARSRSASRQEKWGSRRDSANDGNEQQPDASSREAGRLNSVTRQEAPEVELLLPNLLKHMGSSDWRRRQEAVISTVDLLSKHAATLAPNSERLMAAFDHFMPRLGDSNSKVCLTTLRALSELLPAVRNQITEIVPLLLPAAAANLASASKPIITATNNVLDMLESCVPLPTMFPTMVNLCVHSNPRVQKAMLNRVADVVPAMYERRPRLVQRHAVPAVLRLVNTARGEMRMATNRALHMLYRAMGDDLVQAIRAAHIQSAAKDQALTSLGVM